MRNVLSVTQAWKNRMIYQIFFYGCVSNIGECEYLECHGKSHYERMVDVP